MMEFYGKQFGARRGGDSKSTRQIVRRRNKVGSKVKMEIIPLEVKEEEKKSNT